MLLLAVCLGLAGCGGEDGSGSQEATLDQEPLIKPLPELQIPTPEQLQDVVTKLNLGYRLVRGGDHEKALTYFDQLQELYPDTPMPYLHQAVGLAASGDPEAAFASVEKAVELGFYDHVLVVDDALMDDVEALPAWPELEKRMRERSEQERPANLVTYRRFDPALEPDFSSFVHLMQHYDSVSTHASRLVMLHPTYKVELHRWEALNHKMAGLEKYRGGEINEEERGQVENELVRTANSYENSLQTPWKRTTVDLITEHANAMIRRSEGNAEACAEAAYGRNRAQWYGRMPREEEDLTEELVEKGLELLAQTDEEYPGTTGGLFGLNDALTLAAVYHGLGAEATRPLLERIRSGYAESPYMKRMGYALQAHTLALEGIPEFSVTDLDGKVWNSKETGGQVLLIDFWATWCAPCRKEIPGLVGLYEKYHDQGFEILGISLDKPKSKTDDDLMAFTQEQGMTWPIVYDKQEWHSAAVQACKVTGIPFPILLNREGQVIAAGEWATGERLKTAVEKLFTAS